MVDLTCSHFIDGQGDNEWRSTHYPELVKGISETHKVEFTCFDKLDRAVRQMMVSMIKATYDPLIDRKNLPNRSIDQIVEVVEKDTTCCALLVKKNTREIEVVQMMTPPHIVDSNPFIRLGSIGFSPELLGTKKQLPHAKMLHSVLMEHLASFHLWAKIPFEDSKLTILTTQNEYLPISDPILARKMLEAVGYVSDISVHESGTVLIQHSSKKYVEKMMLRQPNS